MLYVVSPTIQHIRQVRYNVVIIFTDVFLVVVVAPQIYVFCNTFVNGIFPSHTESCFSTAFYYSYMTFSGLLCNYCLQMTFSIFISQNMCNVIIICKWHFLVFYIIIVCKLHFLDCHKRHIYLSNMWNMVIIWKWHFLIICKWDLSYYLKMGFSYCLQMGSSAIV